MSYLTDVYDLLRSARDELPAAELRALACRILDDRRPALAVLAEGSENHTLQGILGLLGLAAQDFLDAAHDLDQVADNINRYVPDIFPAGRPPPSDAVIEEWHPAARSVSVPHPARRFAPEGTGEGIVLVFTTEWAAAISRVLPERSGERTTGVCVTADGTQVEVVSGGDEESAPVDLILADSQHFPRPRLDGGFGVSTHVETKIAYRMRTLGITYAAVIVNNRVCGGPFSCTEAVPAILPRGYTLAVWQPGAGKPLLLKGKAQP